MSRRLKAEKKGVAEIAFYEASGLDAVRGRMRGENITEGSKVAQLFVRGKLVMSDSPDEYRDHVMAIHYASGRVLINGLGIGCYLSAILAKPRVNQVDVVEVEQDVIDLMTPYFSDMRVTFHCADAYTKKWPPGTHWDYAWHDIWADKCTDDLEGHSKLLRSYGRRATQQGCWAHEELLYYRSRGR